MAAPRRIGIAAALGALLGVLGCTGGSQPGPAPEPPASGSATPGRSAPTPSVRPTPTPPESGTPAPSPPQPTMDAGAALRDIRRLAGDIGPREATSRNFAEAADLVAERFERLGYDVRRTSVRVPAGNSWGTPVPAGRSANVIAEPRGFDPTRPHVVIGAHLDTVPVAPGAEDNASGVAVLLELARVAAAQPRELAVQFIAFGAEEPRGTGDALHHFGSQQYVAALGPAERRAVRGMLALDRVGVRSGSVPVCRADAGGAGLQRAIRSAAGEAEIPTRGCQNTSSDHWSYAKAGMPAVRLGSVPYAGYHSPGDTPSVVDRRQLDRTGRAILAWLSSLD